MPEAAPEEEKKAEPAAEVVEAESFGFPHSLLRANDIDPGILLELPEDIRELILSPL